MSVVPDLMLLSRVGSSSRRLDNSRWRFRSERTRHPMRCAIQESKMSSNQQSFEFRAAAKPGQPLAGDPTLQLLVSLNVQAGAFEFEWLHASSAETAACGRLAPIEASIPGMFDLEWELQVGEKTDRDSCNQWPASVRALLNRLRKALPTTEEGPRVCLFTSVDIGPAKTGTAYPMHLPAGEGAWK